MANGAKLVKHYFPLHMINALNALRKQWRGFGTGCYCCSTVKRDPRQDLDVEVEEFYPDEEKPPRRRQYRGDGKCRDMGLVLQPIDSIAEYFGAEVGFFIAFQQFYTNWLWFPSLMGVCLFFTQINSNSIDGTYIPLFGFLMIVWTTLFVGSGNAKKWHWLFGKLLV